MTTQTYVRALRKGWWIVVLAVLAGAGGGLLYTAHATSVYSSKVTFFVSTPSSTDSSGLSSDQFAQHRANSYALLLSSDSLGARLKASLGTGLPAGALAAKISGSVEVDTVILTATVTSTSAPQATTIAAAVATDFPALIQVIEKRPGQAQSVSLVVVSGPTPAGLVSPHKKINVLIAVALGLAAGVVLALLRMMLDTTFRSTEVLSEETTLPLLATFDRSAAVRRAPLLAGEALRSTRAEVFRQLRTNLKFIDFDHPAQIIVITSSVAEEGKSVTAANLALVFAETGGRVLLIEADLRRPKVGEYFGIEDGLGLTNVLAGQLDVGQVLQPWGPDNLTILPAGPLPPNPSEMLGSANMVALLAELRSRFDTIIIDAPPVVPVTDAAVVAAMADGVVLVVRYGKTTKSQAAATLRDLRAVDAHLFGTVFTMRPPRTGGARRSAQYYYNGDLGGRARLTDIAPEAVRPATTSRSNHRVLGGTVPDGPAQVVEERPGEALPSEWNTEAADRVVADRVVAERPVGQVR